MADPKAIYKPSPVRRGDAGVAPSGDIAILGDAQPSHGVVIRGRFVGWLVWKHPDGQWVTIRKLEMDTL
jgi:hypothetical protein